MLSLSQTDPGYLIRERLIPAPGPLSPRAASTPSTTAPHDIRAAQALQQILDGPCPECARTGAVSDLAIDSNRFMRASRCGTCNLLTYSCVDTVPSPWSSADQSTSIESCSQTDVSDVSPAPFSDPFASPSYVLPPTQVDTSQPVARIPLSQFSPDFPNRSTKRGDQSWSKALRTASWLTTASALLISAFPYSPSSPALSPIEFSLPLTNSPPFDASFSDAGSPEKNDYLLLEYGASKQTQGQWTSGSFSPYPSGLFGAGSVSSPPLSCTSSCSSFAPDSHSFYALIDSIVDDVRNELAEEKALYLSFSARPLPSAAPLSPITSCITLASEPTNWSMEPPSSFMESPSASFTDLSVDAKHGGRVENEEPPAKKARKVLPPPPASLIMERVDIANLTKEELAERKRLQNRASAQRYRMKIRNIRNHSKELVSQLEERRADLLKQESELKMEIARYRVMMLGEEIAAKKSAVI